MTESELCRLCAESKENLVGIYDAEGRKLAIEAKIAKCLRIQVTINDGLPLSICIDCCVLLNQCSEFFEKTNQAQTSLRQLLIDPKTETSFLDVRSGHFNESTPAAFLKKEEVSIDECKLLDDPCIHSSTEIAETFFSSTGNNKEERSNEVVKEKNAKVSKKLSSKQTKKKQNKKKNMQSQKADDNEINISAKCENGPQEIELINQLPDNHPTITAIHSDLDTVENHPTEAPKSGRKRGEGLDKYPWLCTDCNDKLPSLEALEEHHENVHNQSAKYMCVQCCKVYDKYYGFLNHVKRHKTKAKFNCDDCGKSFVHKKVLESHKAIHSEERPYVCQTCGKAFRQQSALYIHSRCHLPDTMKNRFPCDQCDKRFSTKPNLVTHKRIHSGVRNFTCDQCGKSFIQKGNLEAHFLTHSPDKPYSCSQCPKAFKTPLQLKKHETVHTGVKPHHCAVCGRTFREKGTLREHHRIHTGAMPFTCEFCGKCFRFKGILTTHRRQHTGERPYSCLECQHHFTNWPNYNKHMKRRHGINTSHTKHLSQSQQQQQQQQQHQDQQQPPQDQTHVIQTNTTADGSLNIQNTEATTVHVIQAVQHTTSSQPIVVQAIPTTTMQNFQGNVLGGVQEPVFRERNTTYFNTMPTALQNFLPSNLPYNFYNISNVTEADLIQHR